ncbi:MAG TPA: hypothetical protein DD294_02735, partial [Psychrobacter sp.]|nr:hypothetical protein [Psychrobacter sp.]
MPSVLNHNNFIAKNINNDTPDAGVHPINVYALLKEREACWWQARQQLIEHQEKKIFWYGENSL